MGHLSNRLADLTTIKQKLAKADQSGDIRQNELDGLLDSRFNKVSDRLSGAIDRLFKESDKHQSKTLTDAVEGLVKAVAERNDVFKEGLSHISEEFALSHNILGDQIEGFNSGVGKSGQSVMAELQTLHKSIGRLPTRFPKARELDQSEVLHRLKMLIDMKDPNIAAELAKLNKRLNKRVVEFVVHRDPMTDLMQTIVATEK